ncbi:hypothetical protein ERO13_D02G122150v2 [Gossypium hirsutum]|nr:hypothetical protein ERO13_D02G122150v2 [Gossypium hirsutum]
MFRTGHFLRSTKENLFALLRDEICVVALFLRLWVFDKSSLTWKVLWDWTMAFPWQPALYTGLFSIELCLWIEIPTMCEVFAWFLLGERWGTTKWIGVALVLGCMIVGGSLMVQIFGSSTIVKGSIEVKKGIEKGNLVLVSQIDKGKLQKKLSTSPIIVRPRKDPMDVF